jgi:predicted O-linked N-acetylglucosamine transferase (SPINDLY family)
VVRQDRIDILVDLAGHTAHNRLECFARRLAPVQVTYLGYPNTSGLANMDYRLTDAIADPPGAEAFYTEKLVRLEKTFFIYAPPESAPPVTPLPLRRNGYVTYGSLNTPAKYNHRVISLWSRLLAGLPQSRLLLVHEGLHADLKDYLHEQFSRQGIHPSRVTLENNLSLYAGHLSVYSQMDIALDPFPWSGHTTTCEALWMGVPTVTLYGKTCVGRMCASTLISVGLSELVTRNDEEYIHAAHKLASNIVSLENLRLGLRERMNQAIFSDAGTFARQVEDAYRIMWKNWCRQEHPGRE